MESNIQKWGNSLGVRIPAFIAAQLSLRSGDSVDIVMENEQISIKPRKYSLATMLKQITPENLNKLDHIDSDVVGREEW